MHKKLIKMSHSKNFLIGRASRTFDKQRNTMNSTKLETTQTRVVSVLRKRHCAPHLEVNPEMATKVVRDYLLPMFAFESKEKSQIKRVEQYGPCKHKRTFSENNGTVYSELKLSDRLSDDVQKMKSETAEARQKLKDSEQKCFEAVAELEQCKGVVEKTSVILNVLHQEIEQLQRENMRLNCMHGNSDKQVAVYEGMYLQVIQANSKLAKELEEEKAINDIR